MPRSPTFASGPSAERPDDGSWAFPVVACGMPFTEKAIRALCVAGAALSLSACGAGAGGSTPPTLGGGGARALIEGLRRDSSGAKIQHVVIIVQENRSFNNLFLGVRGAKTQSYGYDTNGNKIALKPIGFETRWDITHSAASFITACNGTGSFPGTDCQMNGFDGEGWGCGRFGSPPCPNNNPPYSYVPRAETKPYFQMAKFYTLADEMFASNFDGSSFISHQYIIAGQASAGVDYPAGVWGCGGGPGDKIAIVSQQRQIPDGYESACFQNMTLGDELDKAHLSWAYYASAINSDGDLWSGYQAIKHIRYGRDWKKDVISPQTNFFNDVANGKLRAVSWVTPTCATSDHAGCGSNKGPSWVASLVNAIGESKYWNSTAIVVFWDDYGGWFDPIGPALADYDGLGIRLPMLCISPYSKQGHVAHTPYEHGSILRFVEDQFGLARLSASDARANSLAPDCIDLTQSPRKFVKITAPLDANYFMHAPSDNRLPDSD